MFKRFADGLVFGAGFAISFLGLWYLATYIINPIITESQLEKISREYPSIKSEKHPLPSTSTDTTTQASPVPFYEMDIDEQIKRSSAIALARYEQAEDGRMKAVIKEFIKKEPNTTIYYKVGDEFHNSSYYPKEGERHGDGVVIFFAGSPATMRMSMSYYGDRISGLGDLPLELFRKKCN